MITRDKIRELAAFESPSNCAITFYYQPAAPKNQSHREEAILVKDLVREALREAEREGGKNECARKDLHRVLDIAESLHGNGGRGKAIFADNSRGLWQEFDLPACLPGTQLIVNRRFHLKPLATVLERVPSVCACLIDRTKARLFRYQDEQIEELLDFFNDLPRRGRSDGWSGYDGGHAERHVANDARQHYKFVAENLLNLYEKGVFKVLIVGCRDEQSAEIESVLHTYLRNNLLGRFRADPATASAEQVKEHVERILNEHLGERRERIVREVIGQAHRNSRGAVGLRHVLRSLETGEAQILLLGAHFKAPGYECRNCGHIDMRVTDSCAMCAQPVNEMDDIGGAIVGQAYRNGVEVMYIANDPEFEKAGHVAALLRFRADQNTAVKQAG
jgi:Bacterial archaeo-eukaryotic release factor family 10